MKTLLLTFVSLCTLAASTSTFAKYNDTLFESTKYDACQTLHSTRQLILTDLQKNITPTQPRPTDRMKMFGIDDANVFAYRNEE